MTLSIVVTVDQAVSIALYKSVKSTHPAFHEGDVFARETLS